VQAVVLTPFADVSKLLTLDPALVVEQGIATADAGKKVTATVKDGAASSGVAEFFFTCGFPAHNTLMLSKSFKIVASSGQAPRDIQIVNAASGNPRWILKTSGGDRNLSRNATSPNPPATKKKGQK